jgi:hypothetical protein
MNLNDILNTIFEQIRNIPLDHPVFIYTGVGTAAGLINRATGILEQKNYHQYPPFLQDLKNTIVNLHLFIILIDPQQEDPPYLMTDQQLKKENVSVFTLRQSVYAEPYNSADYAIDITVQLRTLNQFAIQNNITTLYHDFSGRRVNLLAEYFDKEIGEHLDHVVYGMSARTDHGCIFDLTDLSAYFPYRLYPSPAENKRTILKLFNVFKYLVQETNKNIDVIDASLYPPYMHEMILLQKNQIITTIKSDLKNNMLSILRIVTRLLNGTDKHEEVPHLYIFNFLPKLAREHSINLFNDRNYKDLLTYLMNLFGKEINVISRLNHLDIDGHEILKFIINSPNSYDWYKNINDFF